MSQTWKKCSSCKKDILNGQVYYVCSVSTCRGNATNYAFCSISCWDAHVPVERHRADTAGAIEKRAPKEGEEPVRMESNPKSGGGSSSNIPLGSDEVLVVVSKVKKYILERSGMNTSAGVFDVLTTRLKRLCDLAIEEARRQGRKTVMDRDVIK